MLNLLTNLLKLDLDDINYYQVNIQKSANNNCKFFVVLYQLFRKTVSHIFKVLSRDCCGRDVFEKHICCYGTRNQYNSLSNIVKNIDDVVLMNINNLQNVYLGKPYRFLLSFRFLISWFFSPLLLFRYLTRKKRKQSLACFIKANLFSYGYFIWYSYFFLWIKPKSIVIANDHSPHFRVIKEACKFRNIPIIYVQHASVTEKFPKLDFNISLLEGEDAYNKYKRKGIDSCVFLVGMLKFDGYLEKINDQKQIKSIGIATNLLDEKERIIGLINQLKKDLPSLKILVRPHPRDNRKFYSKICEQYGFTYSDAEKEKPFEFLQKVDANISGESSIHLEAALMNVYPIYYRFGPQKDDYYGYIKNGLITDVFDAPIELINNLKQKKNSKPNIRHRSKYYVSTVNSIYDGSSIELIKKIFAQKFNEKNLAVVN